jgi:molecular chaperone HtpG
VLLLTERVDEWMLSYLHEFDGKELVSVARGDLDLGALADETEKAEQEKAETDWKDVVDRAKGVLEGKAKDVRVTLRLTESASCLVSDDGDMSGYLQRLLKQAGQKAPDAQPILELNPEHALVKKLRDVAGDEAFADRVSVLFDQALLAEGGMLEDPATYVQRVNRLLA